MDMYALDVGTRTPSRKLSSTTDLAELENQIQRRWPSLPNPIMLEWWESQTVGIDRSGIPWILSPVERDPLRSSRGKTVVPDQQLARLKEIADVGVPFQRLAIAHELDPDGPVRQFLPDLESGPRTCSNELARTLVGDVPTRPAVARAVRVLDAIVGGATSTLPKQLLSAVLDPIIFGIIAPTPPQHGQLCLWYPLVAWRW
jgi:hypothetical protein